MRRATFLFLPVLLLGAAPASLAGAQETRCPPAVRAWVDRAARDIGTPISTAGCGAGRVRVRLAPPGSPPLDVELAPAAGRTFRRVGALGLSPLLEVPDFAAVALPRRRAFEGLSRWVAAHEREVVLGAGAPVGPGRRDLGALHVLGALVLAALALRRRGVAWGEVLPAVALVVAALGARLGLGAWGPWHINGQGPLWLEGALRDPAALAAYGPGYPELVAWVTRAAPGAPDTAVFVLGGVLSALAPALVYALGRLAGLERSRAVFAGVLLAVDPVAVLQSTTESYFNGLLTLVLAVSVGFLAAGEALLRRERVRAALLAGAAALLAAQAARVHPVAWLPVSLATLAPLALAGATLRARVLLAGAAVTLAGTVALLTSGRVLAAVLAVVATRERSHPDLSRLATGLVLLAAATGIVAGRARPRGLLVPAACAGSALLLTRHVYAQGWLWQHGYDLLFLPAIGLALVATLPPRWASTATVVAAVFAALSFLAVPALRERTTEQEEYRWLRRHLDALPDGCATAHVSHAGRRTLFLPVARHRASLRFDARSGLGAAASALAPPACVYYVHTSLCAGREGAAACAELERSLVLGAPVKTTFSARPSHADLPYESPRVEVRVARVRGGDGLNFSTFRHGSPRVPQGYR